MPHYDIKLYNPLITNSTLNIYYFRFNIFKKRTFKGLFEKKGTFSENIGECVGGRGRGEGGGGRGRGRGGRGVRGVGPDSKIEASQLSNCVTHWKAQTTSASKMNTIIWVKLTTR